MLFRSVDLIGTQNAAGATFKNTDLVFPISLSELQRNTNLAQEYIEGKVYYRNPSKEKDKLQ